jgi:hypothetical protein
MFTGYVPHVGMNNIGPGVPTVLIGGLPASTVGDNFLCAGPPAPVVIGAFNVLIGTGAGGGGGKGGGKDSTTMEGLKSGKIKPPKGTESLPLEIQAVMAECQPYIPPETFKRRVEQLVLDYGETDQTEPPDKITIADFVEILEAVESEEGYEAARFFSSYLDFGTLISMAMGFISGDDPNPENDPNIMPTRFMILYGADDAKLQQIDNHPDCADGEEHTMNVANLRKGLRLLGYAVEDGCVYDEYVYMAHLQYMARCASRNASLASNNTISHDELSQNDEHRDVGDGVPVNGSENRGISEETNSSGCIKSTNNNSSLNNDDGEFTLTLQIDVQDPCTDMDRFIMYSTDQKKKYYKVLTIKDDLNKNAAILQLKFTGMDKSLSYTLEVDPVSSGNLEVIFKNIPYGKWSLLK